VNAAFGWRFFLLSTFARFLSISARFISKNPTFLSLCARKLHFWPRRFFPLCLFSKRKTRRRTMADGQVPQTTQKKVAKVKGGNPFASGFKPNGKRKERSQSYLTKKSLLKTMLEVDITIQDLPTVMADELRRVLPGWFDNVEKRFTMRQIMELVQFQLLFSKSDYVKQDAINAIKDRVDGKAVQKVQVEQAEAEPTEIKLPGGRIITI
jgi:hypothetical protein